MNIYSRLNSKILPHSFCVVILQVFVDVVLQVFVILQVFVHL